MHNWTVEEDIFVYYYHYFKLQGLKTTSLPTILSKLGISQKAFLAREQNLIYIISNGQHGLSNPPIQLREIVDLFSLSFKNANFQTNLAPIVNRII